MERNVDQYSRDCQDESDNNPLMNIKEFVIFMAMVKEDSDKLFRKIMKVMKRELDGKKKLNKDRKKRRNNRIKRKDKIGGDTDRESKCTELETENTEYTPNIQTNKPDTVTEHIDKNDSCEDINNNTTVSKSTPYTMEHFNTYIKLIELTKLYNSCQLTEKECGEPRIGLTRDEYKHFKCFFGNIPFNEYDRDNDEYVKLSEIIKRNFSNQELKTLRTMHNLFNHILNTCT